MNMSSSFYLTLPSNSSHGFFPDNRAGHYFTKLPQTVELSGDYEVGLSEIQFVSSYINVSRAWLTFIDMERIGEDERFKILLDKVALEAEAEKNKIFLPEGLYSSNEAFVKSLSRRLKRFENKTKVPPIKLSYNRASRKIHLKVYDHVKFVKMSEELQNILGFSKREFLSPGDYHSESTMELHDNFRNVFVYCDIVRPRIVGDALVPLIRSVPAFHKDEFVHVIYEKPHYIPLSRFQFSSLEIILADNMGREILFKRGYTVITLHIRRRKPDY